MLSHLNTADRDIMIGGDDNATRLAWVSSGNDSGGDKG
jgi:hypothetical protein